MTEKIALENKQLNIHPVKNADSPPLVVLIHGLTGNYLQMHHFQSHLSDRYDTVSYDLSGRGDSDLQKAPTDIHQHTDDLMQFLNKTDYSTFILIGYSMGGYIALEAAAKMKGIEKVILLDGGGEAGENTSNLVLPSLGRLDKKFESVDAYREMMQQSYGALGVEWSSIMDKVIEHEVENIDGTVQHKSDYSLTKQDFESFYEFPHADVYKNVKAPVFLIICTGAIKDGIPLFSKDGYDKMLSTVPSIKSSTYDINHYEIVFNEQNDLNQEIDDFLKKE
ncbi:alpha/beta fold hydrolase [Salinicoccus sp. RF5]|uniref:alpha/beta fold hydrolase n=1 Tax=Salinicoccus sp. RF5 TaxID=2748874 RepID=UPI001E3F9769|nr:alpha/beta hydrolase [Salinicoccus sp. RF5]MCC4722875.1 alpha/beta hydrolase [Salinicoccus sp. RF5]